jgi:hypothetical protein
MGGHAAKQTLWRLGMSNVVHGGRTTLEQTMSTMPMNVFDHEYAARVRSAPRGLAEYGGACPWSSRHGIERVSTLHGNVGYLEIRRFQAGEAARMTAETAMRRLAMCSSLILDLRRHTGGEHAMAALLTSLLFDTEPLYGETVYTGGARLFAGTSVEARCAWQPVTVLVSAETSGSGRAFAENLERLGRAAVAQVAL